MLCPHALAHSMRVQADDKIDGLSECLPMAPLLPLAMIGNLARPASSLGQMLHQVASNGKETTRYPTRYQQETTPPFPALRDSRTAKTNTGEPESLVAE